MKPLDVHPGQLWVSRADPRVVVEVRFVTNELLPWVRYWRPHTMVTAWAQLGSFRERFTKFEARGAA